MSKGKNKQFMNNPSVFLSNHSISVNPYDIGKIPSPGPTNIDLVPTPQREDVVKINNYNLRKHKIGAKPIKAYWLPAKLNDKKIITLGNAANYFFTSDLSGCIFAAYFDNMGRLKVEHTNARNNTVHELGNRLAELKAMLINREIRCLKILNPIPWPIDLGKVPAGPNNIVQYNGAAWVIGGRLTGGWRFRYKLSISRITHIL